MQRVGSVLVIIMLAGLATPPTLADSPNGPVALESNERGLTLTWTPPAYQLTAVEVAGRQYSRVEIAGLRLSGRPGYPQLPFYSGLIGLPASGEAWLQVVEVERETVSLPYPPLPAPSPQPVHLDLTDAPALPTGGPTTLSPDPDGYAANAFYPSDLAQLGPPQQLRNWRVAALTINPIRVNLVTGQMEVVRSLRLEITFDQPASPSLTAQAAPNSFTQALATTLLNPEAAQWPGNEEAMESPPPLLSSSPPLYKVIVAEAGLYALTYNDLAGAGLPVANLDPRTLQLHHGQAQQEVAILVEGEADGVFNPGDRLLFYAEPEFSRFTVEDVYFLSFGVANGLRMASRSGAPTGLPAGIAWRTTLAETNHYYDSLYPGRDGDRWYWAELRRPDKTVGAYPISLEAPLTTGPAATLTLWLQGYTDPAQNPDHRVAVSVNGTPVGEKIWNGAQAIEANFTLPAASLRVGANQVTLSLPGISGVSIEGMWLDAFALTYPTGQAGTGQLRFKGEAGRKVYILTGWPSPNLSVYDITVAHHPRRVTNYQLTPAGTTYTLSVGDADTSPAAYLVAPNNQIKTPLALTPATPLSHPANGADYLIITHPDFAAAVAPLAAHRAGQGLRVVTVDVNAIYDSYGAGRMTPEGIRAFLQDAYDTWKRPALLYVLLVGDSSYDFKNFSGYNPQTFIPPYLADVDPWLGETAADNRFVTLAGDDALPDLLIGRLAVTSPAEAATVVDKIIHYEMESFPGGWNARQLFVSDNPDSAGDFYADADQAYNHLAQPLVGYRFYYSPTGGAQPYFYSDITALRTAFLANFNQGASLVTFHGHSSWHQWAIEALFQWHLNPALNDVTNLKNGYRLPVVLGMTCFTGFFHHPRYPTLDESLLRQAGGGAVAVWGATGLGISTSHTILQEGFYRVMIDQGQTNLGAAVLAGKMDLYATGLDQDLLDTFTLFGDPALNVNFMIVPFAHQLYLPLIKR